MVINEKIKYAIRMSIVGGVGFLIYKAATTNDRLRDAIDHIQKAQTLITSSIATIESAKGDIKDVRTDLQKLQDLAKTTQSNLDKLRAERENLEKTVKETLSNSRTVIKEQRHLVDEFQKLKSQQDSIVGIISPIVTRPFSPKN
jgi:chromosome segregation ATPase